jgi:hypothetical protein
VPVLAVLVLASLALVRRLGGGGVAVWIAGFVTPGAPGGLGIREAAMVMLDGSSAPARMLVVTAAMFRLVTFAGDLLCFALGRLLFRETGVLSSQASSIR